MKVSKFGLSVQEGFGNSTFFSCTWGSFSWEVNTFRNSQTRAMVIYLRRRSHFNIIGVKVIPRNKNSRTISLKLSLSVSNQAPFRKTQKKNRSSCLIKRYSEIWWANLTPFIPGLTTIITSSFHVTYCGGTWFGKQRLLKQYLKILVISRAHATVSYIIYGKSHNSKRQRPKTFLESLFFQVITRILE